mmetsp:Transcript_7454/g.15202  ORF Transcript_7454/g.15202 Transcript_7454/m.15202 type:complete len:233 (-) Transcript_7454:343-1041(-)
MSSGFSCTRATAHSTFRLKAPWMGGVYVIKKVPSPFGRTRQRFSTDLNFSCFPLPTRPPPLSVARKTSSALRVRLPCLSRVSMMSAASSPSMHSYMPSPTAVHCSGSVTSGLTTTWKGHPGRGKRPTFTVPVYSPVVVQQYDAWYAPPSRGPSTTPVTYSGPRSSRRKRSAGMSDSLAALPELMLKSARSPATAASSPAPLRVKMESRDSPVGLERSPQKPTLKSPVGITVT